MPYACFHRCRCFNRWKSSWWLRIFIRVAVALACLNDFYLNTHYTNWRSQRHQHPRLWHANFWFIRFTHGLIVARDGLERHHPIDFEYYYHNPKLVASWVKANLCTYCAGSSGDEGFVRLLDEFLLIIEWKACFTSVGHGMSQWEITSYCSVQDREGKEPRLRTVLTVSA